MFRKDEIPGRMGGDEFIAIVTDACDYDIEGRLLTSEAEITKNNEANKESGVTVSAAYGYCISTELSEPKPCEVYKEADRRMYKHKEQYYKEKGLGRRKYDCP